MLEKAVDVGDGKLSFQAHHVLQFGIRIHVGGRAGLKSINGRSLDDRKDSDLTLAISFII
jgi:hypothetical protein